MDPAHVYSAGGGDSPWMQKRGASGRCSPRQLGHISLRVPDSREALLRLGSVHVLFTFPFEGFAIMAPKRKHPRGAPIILDAVHRTYAAAKAKALAARPSPYASSSSSLPSAPPPSVPAVANAATGGADVPGRPDFAVLRNSRRGGYAAALELADSVGMDSLAQDLRRDREAASGRGGRDILIGTWSKFHAEARSRPGGEGLGPLFPLTSLGMMAVASLFKAGGYRSFANYLSAVKGKHIEEGHYWSEQLDQTGRWITRSVLRGIGPARQSRPLCIKKLLELEDKEEPVTDDGPVWPLRAILLGSIFLLREVELASAQVRHLQLDHVSREITWHLASSKTDPSAMGTKRTWGCLCDARTLPCPYHLAKAAVQAAMDRAGDGDTSAQLRSPLFPTRGGTVPSKAKMVLTLEHFATQCGEPLVNSAGLRVFGGHSMRVTGAQTLAAQGIEVSKIRILARHSGDAVLRYVAEAPLTTLRADLGISESSASTIVHASGARVWKHKVEAALAKLDKQEAQISALQRVVTASRAIVFAQNLRTMAIHAMRPGDSVHTACGWGVGPRMQARGGVRWLHTIEGELWTRLCERCLLPERRAAQLTAQALESESE